MNVKPWAGFYNYLLKVGLLISGGGFCKRHYVYYSNDLSVLAENMARNAAMIVNICVRSFLKKIA